MKKKSRNRLAAFIIGGAIASVVGTILKKPERRKQWHERLKDRMVKLGNWLIQRGEGDK